MKQVLSLLERLLDWSQGFIPSKYTIAVRKKNTKGKNKNAIETITHSEYKDVLAE